MKKKNIWLLIVLIICGYFIINKFLRDNRIPSYDINETWVCKKFNSDETRTYVFNKNGQVKGQLDSNPEENYLIGNYVIDNYELKDSLFLEEKDGKYKKYKLTINFEHFVMDGIDRTQDSVSWVANVYNGNEMQLDLPGGTYWCVRK